MDGTWYGQEIRLCGFQVNHLAKLKHPRPNLLLSLGLRVPEIIK